MWAWVYRVLMIAGPAAIGYFTNDVGDGFTRVFPGTTDPKTGKIAWWWLVIILLIIAGLFVWLVSVVVPKKQQSK
jgi:hypothetical protein